MQQFGGLPGIKNKENEMSNPSYFMIQFKQLIISIYSIKAFVQCKLCLSSKNTYTFSEKNRDYFDKYLKSLFPMDLKSKLYLQYQIAVNRQCDIDKVVLLNDEVEKLIELYAAGVKLNIREASKIKVCIYQETACNFKEDSLAFRIRKYKRCVPKLFSWGTIATV